MEEGIHMEMNGVQISESGRTSAVKPDTSTVGSRPAGQTAFDRLLQDRAREGLNFSKHAAKRMNERGIAFDSQLMSDLEHAVEGARKKGARDVAVIGAQGVFIVNVPNQTVVTAMDSTETNENIFTNINGAVII